MAVAANGRTSRIACWLLASMIMLGSAGCGWSTPGVPTPTPRQVDLTGTFQQGCSPVDASGIIIDLTSNQLPGFIQISMWGDFSLDPGSRLPLAVEDDIAVAAYCRATNDCQVASQGELAIMHADETNIQGEIWMALPQEGMLQGLFEAQWVDSGPVICG